MFEACSPCMMCQERCIFLQLDFRAVAFLGQENLPSLKPSRDVFAASPEQDGLALCSSDVHGQGPQKGQCVPLA